MATASAAFSLAACSAFLARTACQMLTVRPTTKAVATAATAANTILFLGSGIRVKSFVPYKSNRVEVFQEIVAESEKNDRRGPRRFRLLHEPTTLRLLLRLHL